MAKNVEKMALLSKLEKLTSAYEALSTYWTQNCASDRNGDLAISESLKQLESTILNLKTRLSTYA